jgi:hypothetical protein
MIQVAILCVLQSPSNHAARAEAVRGTSVSFSSGSSASSTSIINDNNALPVVEQVWTVASCFFNCMYFGFISFCGECFVSYVTLEILFFCCFVCIFTDCNLDQSRRAPAIPPLQFGQLRYRTLCTFGRVLSIGRLLFCATYRLFFSRLSRPLQ